MKRFISLILVAILSASVFAACKTSENTAVNLTLASSDAAELADWLTERVGEIPNEVVLGIGSSDEYGMDMSDFEDDGYILKTVNGTTVCFGKTEDGLDRAVRAYAKAVQNGTEDTLDITYHEGYRIKKLTVAGRDISEYTIYYPADANANMKFAVSELQQLVEKACGAKLKAVEGAANGLAIEFRFKDDPALESDGYVYTVTDNGILFEGAVKRGAMYAVYRFLQNECGWDCLAYGDSYLNEAEHIDIPVGTSKTETPFLEYFEVYTWKMRAYETDRMTPTDEQNSYGAVPTPGHGFTKYDLMNGYMDSDFDYDYDQPCYNDAEVYELIRDNVLRYIEANYDYCLRRGVDISQPDNPNFCMCETCFNVYLEEGGNAGSVVRFANKLSEELNEIYSGLIYQIFAYNGTNQPPKVTVPNEHVYLGFCYDFNCSNHTIDGSECTTAVSNRTTNNKDFAEWLDGWCDLTDNMYVWTYTLDTGLHQFTIIDNIREDMQYLRDNDVRGMFHESETWNLGIRRIEHQLMAELNWNPDMSEEEYEALLCKLLEREFGAGWMQIRNFIREWEKSQDLADCWHCWGWTEIGPSDKRYNTSFYRERFDSFVEMFDDALYMADSAEAESRVELLSCTMLYMGCYSSYYFEELNGNTERMAVLADRYLLVRERLRNQGINPDKLLTLYNTFDYADTIEEAAAKDWLPYYEKIMGMSPETN